MLSPVSLRAGIPPRYVTKPTRSTQPCIPLGSLNRVLALIGWGKGGDVTSAGWQVTLCDPIWHVSSRSGEAVCELLYTAYLCLQRNADWLTRRHNWRVFLALYFEIFVFGWIIETVLYKQLFVVRRRMLLSDKIKMRIFIATIMLAMLLLT